MIKIHYNLFETLEEQLKLQNYKCSDLKIFENLKNNILYLWVHNILTDSEKERCIHKLNNQIIRRIIKENKIKKED